MQRTAAAVRRPINRPVNSSGRKRNMQIRKQKRRQRRKLVRFIKLTVFCAVILQIAVVAGWAGINQIIRPPDIVVSLPADTDTEAEQIVYSSEYSLFMYDEHEDTEPDYEEIDAGSAPTITANEARKPDFYTFLVFGLTEGLNANTIMVASYDARTGRGHVISIPRDTQVDVTRNNRKIVAAYNVGRLNDAGHKGGVNRLKDEVQTIVGFRPDFYVRIDYEAFIRMVNAVGGVEVYVPFHMRYDDPYQDLHIDLSAGQQTLDGYDALRFARYRRGNNPGQTITDYQRIEHQQQIIDSIFRGLLTPLTILRIPEFVSIFNNHLYTDLSHGELLWFANEMRGLITGTSAGALEFHTLPMLGTSGAPHWFEWADERGIVELVNQTVNPFVRDITSRDLRIVP